MGGTDGALEADLGEVGFAGRVVTLEVVFGGRVVTQTGFVVKGFTLINIGSLITIIAPSIVEPILKCFLSIFKTIFLDTRTLFLFRSIYR